MNAPSIREVARVHVARSQQARWRSGELVEEWFQRFPQLFDADDHRLALSQGNRGYHFWEWLGAVVLHHTTSYFALVSKYEFGKHARKQQVVQRLLPSRVLEALRDRASYGKAQPPDLLMYAPDYSNWFFCEVKGPGDRFSAAQRTKFEALARLSDKPVGVLTGSWLDSRPRAVGG